MPASTAAFAVYAMDEEPWYRGAFVQEQQNEVDDEDPDFLEAVRRSEADPAPMGVPVEDPDFLEAVRRSEADPAPMGVPVEDPDFLEAVRRSLVVSRRSVAAEAALRRFHGSSSASSSTGC